MSNIGQAGYESNTSGLTSVNLTTTTVVPKIKKCSKTDTTVIPFVGVYDGMDQSAAVGIFLGCTAGKARYYPIFALDDVVVRDRGLHAQPGDELVLRVKGNSARVSLSFVDKTHPGVSGTHTGSGSSSFSRPTVGDSKGPKGLPIPDFGTVSFSKSILNGKALGLAPALERFNMVSASVLEIKTSPFRSDNESFKTVFKHS